MKTKLNNHGTAIETEATPSVRRKLSAKASDLLSDRDGTLPVWIRSPKGGPDRFCGFTRSKLYELAASGEIRSVSIRHPGQVKGTRLFHLGSVLEFIERCEKSAMEVSQ